MRPGSNCKGRRLPPLPPIRRRFPHSNCQRVQASTLSPASRRNHRRPDRLPPRRFPPPRRLIRHRLLRRRRSLRHDRRYSARRRRASLRQRAHPEFLRRQRKPPRQHPPLPPRPRDLPESCRRRDLPVSPHVRCHHGLRASALWLKRRRRR